MKKLIILSGVLATVFASCGNSGSGLKTVEDSAAYAIGLNLGQFVSSFDSTLNVNLIAAGLEDYLKDSKGAKFDEQQINEILQGYVMITLPERNKKYSEEFLAEVEKNPNVKKTESGLLYEIIEAGDESVKAEDPGDRVTVNYKGTLMNGKEFDANDSTNLHIGQVVPGWSEGIKLIGKGGKIKLWIPSDLAYGPQGAGGVIPGNNAILFDVELLDVLPVSDVTNPANPDYTMPAN